MHITKVEVSNFRSLQSVTANFKPGLNVLVGRNNAGKSNLLDAVRHAIGPAGTRGEGLWVSRDDFFKASADSKAAETISVTLTFEGLTEAQRSFFFEIVDFNIGDLSQSKAILHFEASWPEEKRHPSIQRWGGGPSADHTPVSSEILEALPITFLPALRDAEAALAPGVKSRLATLLKELAARKGPSTKEKIEGIFKKANDDLEGEGLIKEVKTSLQATTQSMAGSDYAPSAIRATPVDLDRILRTLRVQMEDMPIGDITANGLGYNNLLYIAVILEHLKTPSPDECPLLLVEEPEAHLHPQLATLLADYLAKDVPGGKTPQTIVTTHSPTLASIVPPNRMHVLFSDSNTKKPCCNSVAKAGMDEPEELALQRMMDITRATLYFARGVILVEGISESLLFPVLARRMKHNLSKLHVSVIPICGVAFDTFKKLFHPDVFGIPVAIVTDADPPVLEGTTWEGDSLEMENSDFKVSDRTKSLETLFAGHGTVKVFHSKVTLEYDLAGAGSGNASLMADIWKDCFKGNPRTFEGARLAAAGNDLHAKALCAWRGICRASHSGSKAEFAQRLAQRLSQLNKDETPKDLFDVPAYVQDAIAFVVGKVTPVVPVAGNSGS